MPVQSTFNPRIPACNNQRIQCDLQEAIIRRNAVRLFTDYYQAVQKRDPFAFSKAFYFINQKRINSKLQISTTVHLTLISR
jgi:hypothetical protein